MKISKSQLYNIIVEEFMKEENLDEADRAQIDKLLRQIRGEEPTPTDDTTKFVRTYGKPGKPPASDTMPLSKPNKEKSVEDKITELVKDMHKYDVANLFNAIYEKIKEKPGTMPDYGGLAEKKSNDSVVAWEELKNIIREVMAESL